MNTLRECSACNWKYPPTYPKSHCKFCGGEVIGMYITAASLTTERTCSTCEKTLPIEQFGKAIVGNRFGYRYSCKACEIKRFNAPHRKNSDTRKAARQRAYERSRERVEKIYEKWLETSDLPFKVLSEKEWLQTCKYFNGCAICGNEIIEARAFFVPFKDGGKYAAWNMIPVCGTCGTESTMKSNPFKWLKGVNAKTLGLTTERAEKIVEYLEQQIARAKV